MLLQFSFAIWGTGENFRTHWFGKLVWFFGMGLAIVMVVLIVIDSNKREQEEKLNEKEKPE